MLRIILALTCVSQMILAFSTFLAQVRFVTTRNPIEMWSYGPCKHWDPTICYIFYQTEQLSALTSGMTIYGTFFLKYKMVSGVIMTKFQIARTYVAFYLPLIASTILVTIILKTQTFSWEAQEHLRLVNLLLGNADYITIAFLSFSKWPNTSNLVVFTGVIILVPIISLYCRKKTLHKLNHQMINMSAARKALYSSFLKGLTVQCMIPYIFYVPIYSLYYYCLLSGQEVLFLEFGLTIVPALPALVDPLVTMYFITPFRRKLALWVKREREETRTSMAFTK